MNPPARPGRLRGDGGTGLLSSWFAFVAFLAFCELAVAVLAWLHQSSTLQAVAADAVRAVASAPPDGGLRATTDAAERQARERLGSWGDDAEFAWAIDTERVSVVVSVDALVLPGFPGGFPSATVRRHATARLEDLR